MDTLNGSALAALGAVIVLAQTLAQILLSVISKRSNGGGDKISNRELKEGIERLSDKIDKLTT